MIVAGSRSAREEPARRLESRLRLRLRLRLSDSKIDYIPGA